MRASRFSAFVGFTPPHPPPPPPPFSALQTSAPCRGPCTLAPKPTTTRVLIHILVVERVRLDGSLVAYLGSHLQQLLRFFPFSSPRKQ